MSGFRFPEDLLPDLLSRLPAKSLVRFRLVSKSWRNLIESPSLSKMCLDQLENSSFRSSMIIIRDHEHGYDRRSKFYAIECSTNTVKELRCPPLINNECSGVKLLGSSNGVLCLHALRKIVLWNPLSVNYWEFFRPQFSYPLTPEDCNFGFGYDKTNNDYKVVGFGGYNEEPIQAVSYEGWIYSLKLKTWKAIEKFSYPLGHFRPYCVRVFTTGILVSGSLHWLSHHELLLAFDLADDKFRLLPMPRYHPGYSGLMLGVFGHCLSFTYNHYCYSRNIMWVMKDYGVEDSWTMINLEILGHSLRPVGDAKSMSQVILIGYVGNKNQIILRDENEKSILLYDFEKESFQKVAQHTCLQAFPYLQTLECYGGTTDGSARKRKRRA